MKIISQTIRNNKYAAIVPLIFGILLLYLLTIKFVPVLILLAFLSFGFSIAVYFLATKKWRIQFDQDKSIIIIEDNRIIFEVPMSNISNVKEIAHFTPRGGRHYTNYEISFIEPVNQKKSMAFTIFNTELDLIKNYDHLKALIIIERSKRAKEIIKKSY